MINLFAPSLFTFSKNLVAEIANSTTEIFRQLEITLNNQFM